MAIPKEQDFVAPVLRNPRGLDRRRRVVRMEEEGRAADARRVYHPEMDIQVFGLDEAYHGREAHSLRRGSRDGVHIPKGQPGVRQGLESALSLYLKDAPVGGLTPLELVNADDSRATAQGHRVSTIT